jgi:hypothetical protein
VGDRTAWTPSELLEAYRAEHVTDADTLPWLAAHGRTLLDLRRAQRRERLLTIVTTHQPKD